MDFIIQTATILFWFIVILIPLIAIHEFGHLLMARMVGVKVLEYGIGIPPRWRYKRWKGIIWSLNFVLLGGFARIYGDHDAIDEAQDTAKTDPKKAKKEYVQNRINELVVNQELRFFLEENHLEYDQKWEELEKSKFIRGVELIHLSTAEQDKIKDFETLTTQLSTLVEWEYESKLNSKEAFFAKKWWQQTLIILGGVIFNLISAVIFLWLMFGITGSMTQYALIGENSSIDKYTNVVYKSENVKVSNVQKDSPADKLGLKSGDDIITFAGVDINSVKNIDEFRNIVKQNENKEVEVKYKDAKSNEFKTGKVLIEKKDGKVLFGIGGLGKEVRYQAKDFVSGFQVSVSQTYDYFILNFKALGSIGSALLPQTKDRSALENVSGPIAVGSFSSKIFKDYGPSGILFLLALISIGLAVFNILPIPALDGGRLVILTINKILGKRNKKIEALAISMTFIVLLIIGVLVAFKDIQGVVTGKY